MDNKITKTRLSAFMAYSWITLLIVAVATILAWEFIYSFTSVKLKREESFYYYYDLDISTANYTSFNKQLSNENNGGQIFSYGIQKIEPTYLLENYNQFIALMQAIDGDAMITSSKEAKAEGEEYGAKRVNSLIDGYSVYDFDKLTKDATEYLEKYLNEDGKDALNFSNLSVEKIRVEFLKRMKNDNRFRTEKQKQQGLTLELSRIENLCNATKRLCLLLELDNTKPEGEKIFYTYRKYEQSLNTAREQDKEVYQQLYDKEQTLRYGLNLSALSGGKYKAEDYFRLSNSSATDSSNVVLIGFDYYKDQPFFQFELITFIDYVISAYGSFDCYA